MRVPWIRLHGGLYDKPVVDRLCHATGIREHEAIGVLATFWSGVAAHGSNGEIASASDAQLEKWAKWPAHRGQRRGAFSAWVRAEHIDAEGRVPEWDDYAGALELRRAKEAQRLAEKRQRLRNSTQTVAQQTSDILQPLQPARANGTERYETIPTKELPVRRRAKQPREAKPEPTWVQTLTALWIDKVGGVEHGRLGRALKPIMAVYDLEAVVPAIDVYASRDEGPRNGRRSVNDFADNFKYWHDLAKAPLVLNGELTERGRRVGGSA